MIDGNGKWKEETDLLCGWCCHPFDTVPIGLPESFCQKTKKFVVRDCFCSFNCAHAYNVSLDDYKVWERFALLNRMKKIIFRGTKYETMQIVCAPPRKILKVFGGNKTIEEMRNKKISVPKKYNTMLPPAIPFFTTIAEIPLYFTTSKNVSMYEKLRSRGVNPASLKSTTF